MKQLPKWALGFACVEGQMAIFPSEVPCSLYVDWISSPFLVRGYNWNINICVTFF